MTWSHTPTAAEAQPAPRPPAAQLGDTAVRIAARFGLAEAPHRPASTARVPHGPAPAGAEAAPAQLPCPACRTPIDAGAYTCPACHVMYAATRRNVSVRQSA